jgi:hypothetical protein
MVANWPATRALKMDLAERREREVIRLRAAGWSFDRIAAAPLPCCPEHRVDSLEMAACEVCQPHLFTNRSGARKAHERAVSKEWGDLAQERERLRRAHMSRLEYVIAKAMERAFAVVDGAQLPRYEVDRTRWAKVVLDAMEQQARVAGLNAPVRLQQTSELDEQIAALALELQDVAREAVAQESPEA